MSKKSRMPDFAGVALVDILANGLAMLIIVIVLSIAARAEHEERTASQVEEVETMMSRRFSTSLVLNSLAASPPAQLHDYDNSPLDQIRDPHLLPIIELHRDFVREFYTGAVWRRDELLREPNAMDAFLATFDDERKRRMRADIYDVAQYYLTMSILRDHGITIRHWHFLPGGLSVAQAGHCPPGVAAKDCIGGDGDAADLPALAGAGAGAGDGERNGDGGGAWPPPEFLAALGAGRGGGATPGPLPGGAAIGGGGGGGGLGGAGNPGGANAQPQLGAGSFPNARPGAGGPRGGGGRGLGGGGGQPQGGGNRMRFRLSSPESARDDQGLAGLLGGAQPTPEQILAALLTFTAELQTTLDAGASPALQLADFNQRIRRALAAPPPAAGRLRELLDFLMLELWTPDESAPPGLEVATQILAENANAALIIAPNKRLQSVTVARPGGANANGGAAETETAFPALRMNAHPDVWRGLTVPLERNALLLLPPDPQLPDELRWRAAAYIAPDFDDFIIGFVYATVAPGGQLAVAAEDNRVRLDGQPLPAPRRPAWFGARGWLVALYATLALGLLGLALGMRRLAPAGRGGAA